MDEGPPSYPYPAPYYPTYPQHQSPPGYPPHQYQRDYPEVTPRSQPYVQQPPFRPEGAQYHHTENTLVILQQPREPTLNAIVIEDNEVNDCPMDCDCCCDNACGRCCASMWKCDKFHKWYSPAGKGAGWIILLLFFYLIAGTVGLAISLCVLMILCFCCSKGD